MSDTDKFEQLIRTMERLSLEVQTMNGRFDTGLKALDERLGAVERQVSEIGSGLAVVLSRSDSNRTEIREAKKKPMNLESGRTDLQSGSAESLRKTTAV